MGKIQDKQRDLLTGGFESVDFKVFDSEGTYMTTEEKQLLLRSKIQLTPLNRDLTKEYERPNKTTEHSIQLSKNYFKNNNAHFLYGDTGWIIQTPASSGVIYDTNEEVKALSGNRYFKTTELSVESGAIAALTMNRQTTKIAQNKPISIGFNYHISTADQTDKFQLSLKVGLQETYDGNGDYLKEYDFQNNEWIDYNGSTNLMSISTIETSTINSWGNFTANLTPYSTDNTDDDVFVDVTIVKIKNIPTGTTNSDFAGFYVDNFFIAETNEQSDQKIIARRKQFPNNGTYTNKYDTNGHFLSNEAKNTDYFIGQFDGDFKRSRDSANKSLEQIITQEKANDYRHFLTRYEGTFRDKSQYVVGMHNKIWMDFGDSYQDPVSAVFDAMTYNLKDGEINVKIHLPNQDDDVDSTYQVIFE